MQKKYKKYKIPLNINLINQIDNTETEVVYGICLESLKFIVDIDIENVDELNKEIINDNNLLEEYSDSENNSKSSNEEDSPSEEGNYEDSLFEIKPKLNISKNNKRKRFINDLDDIYD